MKVFKALKEFRSGYRSWRRAAFKMTERSERINWRCNWRNGEGGEDINAIMALIQNLLDKNKLDWPPKGNTTFSFGFSLVFGVFHVDK